jgi:hypothetical protein
VNLRNRIAQINPRLVACLLIIFAVVSLIVGYQFNVMTITDGYILTIVTLLLVALLETVKRKGEPQWENNNKHQKA